MASSSLKSTAAKGILWSGISSVASTLLIVVVTAILANILPPADFGLVNLALVFVGLLSTLNDIGLGAGIVQQNHPSPAVLSTCFWVNILVGFALWLLICLVAPFLAAFYDEPQLASLVIITGLTLAITPLGSVHRALLIRQFQFKSLAILDVVALTLGGALGIGAAIAGFGAVSIALQEVLRVLIRSAGAWGLLNWRPKWSFDWLESRPLFKFGTGFMASSMLNYFISNFDNLLVGKLFGATALGFYSVAYFLATLPSTKIVPLITAVSFPLFARIQDQYTRLKQAYEAAVYYVTAISFPTLVGLFVLAPEFIHLFYGDEWVAVIPLIRLLCVAGALYSLTSLGATTLLSAGRSDLLFLNGIVRLVLLGGLILVGASRLDLAGIAGAVSVYTIIAFPIMLYLVDVACKIGAMSTISALKTPLLASSVLLPTLLVYKWLLYTMGNDSAAFVLTTGTILGAAFYFSVMYVFDRDGVHSTFNMIRTAMH